MQTYVAVVGGALLLLPLGQILIGAMASVGDAAAEPAPVSRNLAVASPGRDELPNVYLLVVDGYGRPDVLESLLGIEEDHGFAAELRERGFVLPERARANYPTTYLSVSTMLEMDYILDVNEHPFPRRGRFVRPLQGGNATVEAFRSLGYRYVHAPPAVWRTSRCGGSEDRCVAVSDVLGETDWAVLNRTPLGVPLSARLMSGVVARASDPSAVVASVLDDRGGEPRLLFAHLLSPHPPYLYTADCSLREGVAYDLYHWRESEIPLYGEAVACLNEQLVDAVDAILAQDEDPVIVIQADHGPEFGIEWRQDSRTWSRADTIQRMATFSAVRLPGSCDREVPEDLTPVNVIRLVLGCVTGEEVRLLPNRFYVGSFKREDMSPARW